MHRLTKRNFMRNGGRIDTSDKDGDNSCINGQFLFHTEGEIQVAADVQSRRIRCPERHCGFALYRCCKACVDAGTRMRVQVCFRIEIKHGRNANLLIAREEAAPYGAFHACIKFHSATYKFQIEFIIESGERNIHSPHGVESTELIPGKVARQLFPLRARQHLLPNLRGHGPVVAAENHSAGHPPERRGLEFPTSGKVESVTADGHGKIAGELGAAHILLLNMHVASQLLPWMVINELEAHEAILRDALLLRIAIGADHFDLLLLGVYLRIRSQLTGKGKVERRRAKAALIAIGIGGNELEAQEVPVVLFRHDHHISPFDTKLGIARSRFAAAETDRLTQLLWVF